jgi:hypothetical protein
MHLPNDRVEINHYSYSLTQQKLNGLKVKPGFLAKPHFEPQYDSKGRILVTYWPILESMWIFHEPTAANAMKSFYERQALDNGTEIDESQMEHFTKFFTNWAKEYLPVLSKIETFEEWISTRYHMKKEKIERYKEGYERYKTFPKLALTNAKNLRKKMVIKSELMNKNLYAAARTINMRDPSIGAVLGPIYNSMTKGVKHAMGNSNYSTYIATDSLLHNIHYTAGLTRNQHGDIVHNILDCEIHYAFIGVDFSKFDSSQGRDIILTEKIVAARMCKDFPEALDLLNTHIEYSAGKWESAFKSYMPYEKGREFKVNCMATRSSGDPQTSFSNTVLNAALISYAVIQILGREGFKSCHLLVNGDDSLLFVPVHHKQTIVDTLAKQLFGLGFKTTMEHSEILSRVEYCSSFFIPMFDHTIKGVNHFLMPKFGNILSKTAISVKQFQTDEEHFAYAANKAEGAYNELCMFPDLEVFFAKLIVIFKHLAGRVYVQDPEYKFINNRRKVSPLTETIEAIADRYDVQLSEVTDWLRGFKRVDYRDYILDHGISYKIAEKDLKQFTDEQWSEFQVWVSSRIQ